MLNDIMIVQKNDCQHSPLESQAAAAPVASKIRVKALNPAREPFGVGFGAPPKIYPSFADHPGRTLTRLRLCVHQSLSKTRSSTSTTTNPQRIAARPELERRRIECSG